jgi:hypothetical protein
MLAAAAIGGTLRPGQGDPVPQIRLRLVGMTIGQEGDRADVVPFDRIDRKLGRVDSFDPEPCCCDA